MDLRGCSLGEAGEQMLIDALDGLPKLDKRQVYGLQKSVTDQAPPQFRSWDLPPAVPRPVIDRLDPRSDMSGGSRRVAPIYLEAF
jgi:hypothetical protein